MTSVSSITATTHRRHAAPAVTSGSRTGVWWRTYRHHVRLLRTPALAWIVVLAGMGAALTAAVANTYSPTELEGISASFEGVPAFEALFGRTVELATVEGFVLWRWGGFAVLLVAVWGMLAAVKLLRGAEEAGHVEPLRAGLLTPRGLLAAAAAATLTFHLLLAIVVGLTHTAAGMDAATAWTLGAVLGLLAAVFAAAGALASQVVASRRRVRTVVGAALGLAFGLRILAAADGTPDWVWWTTPFGWAGFLHEVDEARSVVLAAFVALVTVLLLPALALAQRDLHGGLVGGGEAVASHARPVRSLVGLAVRAAAGPALGWGAILVTTTSVFAMLAHDFAGAIAELTTPVEVFAQVGFVGIDTPAGVVAMTLDILMLVLALFAASQVASIREEEASWRIEHLLVRPVGRLHWLASRTAVAAVAIVLLALGTGLAAWIGTALTGPPLAFGDMLLAALNLVPAPLLFLGLGVAGFGLVPRLTAPVAYGLVLTAYLLDFAGGLLELPEQVRDASPFRHVAAVPVADLAAGPLLAFLAVGALGVLAGLAAFRRRDLEEA